ncbi:hypothetical protein [Neobacillus niacini]|uniref:hypothetical protein n=1 Tax=Neobacillus niacini TaxID=86668 RepID=UPI00286C6A8B|nr:hypothetical protein [Neobacillus niacini]
MSEMLLGQPPFVHRMLEAASVYWRFNEERLEAIMDTGLEADAFRKFVGMPFVIMNEDGWMLHDAVRAWTLEDFMLRKPNTYEQMRCKALQYIRMEESLNPLLGQRPPLDKLNLHEHPLVRTLCFYGHMDDMEVRQCRECDLPVIRDLYIKSHQFTSTSRVDLLPLVNRISKLWEVAPSAFITIWRNDNIVAFFGKIPLHDEQVIQEIKSDPLLQPFINGWEPIPNAYLIALVGIDPQLEWRYRSYFIHTLLNHYCSPEWILALTSWREWFPVFELCGFERAAWADTTIELGTDYQAYVLDLRKEDFITKLDRSVNHRSTAGASTLMKAEPYIQELKDILKHWAVLPSKPLLIQTYGRLFPHRLAPDISGEKAGYNAKNDLGEAIRCLTEGNEQEEMLGKLLTTTYIEGVRPLERAAKSLNLSTATYYRHLNKALELLYQVLVREGS